MAEPASRAAGGLVAQRMRAAVFVLLIVSTLPLASGCSGRAEAVSQKQLVGAWVQDAGHSWGPAGGQLELMADGSFTASSVPAAVLETHKTDPPSPGLVTTSGQWSVRENDLGGASPHVTLQIPNDAGAFDLVFLYIEGSAGDTRLWVTADNEDLDRYQMRRLES